MTSFMAGPRGIRPAAAVPVAPLLVIRGLTKVYGDKTVLAGVDLAVERGETVVVLGGSGSGKSTLARLLVGLERASGGHIFVEGRDLTRMNERELAHERTRFAMVFQKYALLDSMSVYDNVAFPLRERGHIGERAIRRRVMDQLAALGIADAAGKLPGELSGGMAKRVGIARAMVMDPEISSTTSRRPVSTRSPLAPSTASSRTYASASASRRSSSRTTWRRLTRSPIESSFYTAARSCSTDRPTSSSRRTIRASRRSPARAASIPSGSSIAKGDRHRRRSVRDGAQIMHRRPWRRPCNRPDRSTRRRCSMATKMSARDLERDIEKGLDEMMAELESLGTEIELKLKLASMDARDTWQKKLEPKLFEARMHAKEAKDEAKKAVMDTLRAFKEFSAVL
jgi:ABC-type ATPase involved in cell division